MIFTESVCQLGHNLGIHVFVGLYNSHEKPGGNAKAKYSVNVGAHYFQMQQRLEHLLEVVLGGV